MIVVAGNTVSIRDKTEGLDDGIRNAITVLVECRSVYLMTHRDQPALNHAVE